MPCRFGLVVVWGEDGDDCGLCCALKKVMGVQFLCMGVWHRLWHVWLERCRDGRYSINALHCDVQLICSYIGVCIIACFLVFLGGWKCFLWRYIPT